ncbi:uncharacterized protein ASCRUDRAFT_77526 [Ascoidea rubescens DSM 1968]|uniref:Uncharacterized protein n=1 Tax=Ascoidea rubescens DSM 1968 TaxID=1344418 RepID=A0A1D2VBE5_9ASCO|nr:hypothetical protein ASCRUDRAFT_77526 [Ascoidea rubescens DSM 1968]ODV58777.1 hypothetical protein ASCRUDRAFT_77526 [Ascoidea rubescens DSM 1968]
MKKYPKHLFSGITQLRCGHVFGPDFQWVAGNLNKKFCAFNNPSPTIYHYLFECSKNLNARIIAGIDSFKFGFERSIQLRRLLGTKEGLQMLICFLGKTWDFRS